MSTCTLNTIQQSKSTLKLIIYKRHGHVIVYLVSLFLPGVLFPLGVLFLPGVLVPLGYPCRLFLLEHHLHLYFLLCQEDLFLYV